MRDIIRAFENFDFNQIVREATRRKWKPRRIGLNEITNFTSCFFFFLTIVSRVSLARFLFCKIHHLRGFKTREIYPLSFTTEARRRHEYK